MKPFHFGVSITTNYETGKVTAAYFQIRKGKVALTQEYADGAAFADYDAGGELLGIEFLAPCKVSIVDQLAANEPPDVRTRTKRFIRENAPRPLVAA